MSADARRNMRITHLDMQNWRNFRQVDVELVERVFLVGPNASGKSNFLDAIRFLSALVRDGGGLQQAVKERGGVSSLRALAARRNPEIGISATLGSGGEATGSNGAPRRVRWRYELRFTHEKAHDNRPVVTHERVLEENGNVLLDRPDERDMADPERLAQTAIEQVTANREFREVHAFFKDVRYLHIVPQLVREPDRSVGRTNDPFGGDFLRQIAETPKRRRDAQLRRIQRALQVAVPQLEELQLVRDPSDNAWHLQGRYTHWRRQGAWQSEAEFSDGTLRLLGLLWALLDGQGPLLLEEPELSLHPDVVRHVPRMLSRTQRASRTRRQIFLSTHSPDLLADPGIGLDEVFLLMPASEGTTVEPASEEQQVRTLLASGTPMAEAVLPRTAPARSSQLALFPAAT
jgi:predicted ATPase